MREANSEEIQEIKAKLEETNQKVSDLENKIKKEIEKVHNFTKEIITKSSKRIRGKFTEEYRKGKRGTRTSEKNLRNLRRRKRHFKGQNRQRKN